MGKGSKMAWVVIGLCVLLADGYAFYKTTLKPKETKPSSSAVAPVAAIEYQQCTVTDMISELKSNALNASDEYKDQYVEISGEVGIIDSDGKYITVLGDSSVLFGIQCFVEDDSQTEAIKTLSVGDKVSVKGKVTDVEQFSGYMMDMTEKPEKVE